MERNTLLNSSDLILYVFASRQELELIESLGALIGQNSFHFDYDRIHRVEKYKQKTLNVTFNKGIESKSHQKSASKASHYNTENKQGLGDSLTVNLIKQNASSKAEYFVLPNENSSFLETLVNAGYYRSPKSKPGQLNKLKHFMNKFSADSYLKRVERNLTRKFNNSFMSSFGRILDLNESIQYVQPDQNERLIIV